MVEKSIVQEAKDIQLAMELISLGARLQPSFRSQFQN